MNDFYTKNCIKFIFSLAASCSFLFMSSVYAVDSSNPCSKYKDSKEQASCINFLNSSAASGQSMVDKYKITPPVKSTAQAGDNAQQNQGAQNDASVSSDVAPTVQSSAQAQEDSSTLTPWQRLNKGHRNTSLPPVNTTVDSSGTPTDHVNIYK